MILLDIWLSIMNDKRPMLKKKNYGEKIRSYRMHKSRYKKHLPVTIIKMNNYLM